MTTDTASRVFHALSDPTRRSILDHVARKPAHVAQISKRFPVSRPMISKHLALLLDAGLVNYKEAGKKRIYHMEPAALASADRWLEKYRHFWMVSLQNLKKYVEKKPARRK